MKEIQHERDRRRFKQNMEFAKQAETDMERQREALGFPKGHEFERFKLLYFKPHQGRD